MCEPELSTIAIGMTLLFAFVNGLHDGGNILAGIVASGAIRPRRTIVMAAVAEFAGAVLLGTAVAHTIAEKILTEKLLSCMSFPLTCVLIISAVAGAIAWKIPSWLVGFPSSGSHALMGGLVGAGLVAAGMDGIAVKGVLMSVIIPLLVSPLLGFLVGMAVFSAIRAVCGSAHRSIGRFFAFLQFPCMVALAAGHGSNDAQKSMGVIAIVLAAPLGGLTDESRIPLWVVLGCGSALALGVVSGGLRIIKKVGRDMWRMQPVHAFASQLAAVAVIFPASVLGGPVSSTQVVGASVMGVGASHRLSSVRWTVAVNVAYAWLLAFPVSALLAALAFWCLRAVLHVS